MFFFLFHITINNIHSHFNIILLELEYQKIKSYQFTINENEKKRNNAQYNHLK